MDCLKVLFRGGTGRAGRFRRAALRIMAERRPVERPLEVVPHPRTPPGHPLSPDLSLSANQVPEMRTHFSDLKTASDLNNENPLFGVKVFFSLFFWTSLLCAFKKSIQLPFYHQTYRKVSTFFSVFARVCFLLICFCFTSVFFWPIVPSRVQTNRL